MTPAVAAGEIGRGETGVLGEGGEHVVQDVLLLADERQAAGDVDVEGDPNAPEHRFFEDRNTADVRGGRVIRPSCGPFDEQESEEHHHRVHGGEHKEHVHQADRANQVFHERVAMALARPNPATAMPVASPLLSANHSIRFLTGVR